MIFYGVDCQIELSIHDDDFQIVELTVFCDMSRSHFTCDYGMNTILWLNFMRNIGNEYWSDQPITYVRL